MKMPAFQFYPQDWRKDIGVQSLSFHDRGIWFELLCIMHESEVRGMLVHNGRAMGEETLSRLIGTDLKTLRKTLKTLLEIGVASKDENGVIFNRRMIRDDAIIQKRRASGRLGGNPNLLNQKDNHIDNYTPNHPNNQNAKQNPTPSSSSSTSSSLEVKEINKENEFQEKINETAPKLVFQTCYTFEEFWNDYDKKRGDKDKLSQKWEKINETERAKIKAYIPQYKAAQPDKLYRKDPASFINQKAWYDELIVKPRPVINQVHSQKDNFTREFTPL
jgi:hypothetical protein